MDTAPGQVTTRFKTGKTKKVRRADVEFAGSVKLAANMAAGHHCQVGLPGCTGRIDQHHHRQMKSQGGLGGLANCLPICNGCHTKIHRCVDWALRHGLLVASWDTPELRANVFGCNLKCETDHRE
jgi:hypothetical protein